MIRNSNKVFDPSRKIQLSHSCTSFSRMCSSSGKFSGPPPAREPMVALASTPCKAGTLSAASAAIAHISVSLAELVSCHCLVAAVVQASWGRSWSPDAQARCFGDSSHSRGRDHVLVPPLLALVYVILLLSCNQCSLTTQRLCASVVKCPGHIL